MFDTGRRMDGGLIPADRGARGLGGVKSAPDNKLGLCACSTRRSSAVLKQ